MSKSISPLFQLSLCTLGCLYSTTNSTLAQVTSDGTVNTQVNQNGNVAEITEGQTRGSNLFHSFQDFSVPTGNEAFFNNANSISNIFSRVTGGNISNIDGLIRANGSASLFLINPAGIVFGSNARLDIGGSFYGSSASSILFEDGEFSTADLENPPLLTVNAPVGLDFRDEPGDIVNRANFGLTEQIFEQEIDNELIAVSRVTNIKGLEVNRGQNIAFIGGNILLEGSGITAPGGNVTLGGLSQAGQISINPNDNFGFPDDVTKADLSLTDNALVSVVADGGGFINIDVSNLTLSGQSRLFAGIAEGMGNSTALAGDIVINASESIKLIGSGEFEAPLKLDLDTSILNLLGLSSDRLNNGETSTAKGESGSILINTDRLEVTERAFIRGRVYGMGNSGDINVVANTISLNNGAITSDVGKNGRGNSGNVTIDTNSLNATNSFVISETSGEGNTGNVKINVVENLKLEDLSIISAQVQFGATGDAGSIDINAGNLQLLDSLILADSRGQGNAGDININITNSISLENNGFVDGASEIVTGIGIPSGLSELDGDLATEDAVGDAGAINIKTKTLNLKDGSQIFALTNDIGNGGNINIQAKQAVFLNNGGQITSQVLKEAIGNGGEINITAPTVALNEFSVISTNTEEGSQGKAGNIIFDTDNLRISNTSIIDARTENEFNGGNITVSSSNVDLLNGGKIVTVTNSSGNSGEITVKIDGDIDIKGSDSIFDDRLAELSKIEQAEANNPDFSRPPQFRLVTPSNILNNLGASSGLFANTTSNASGSAGSIQVTTPKRINLSDQGIISVEANSQGGAGRIIMTAEALNLDNSSLLASTLSGEGGNIDLSISEVVSLKNSSFISAQAFDQANGGNLTIDANFIIAFPNGNNDILASSEQGQGGNISINAESLLGIQERSLSNSTNDINASSEFSLDGNVSINTPDINPVQGTTELPTNVVKPEETTAQACNANRETVAQNGLTIKGKGGILPVPALPLDSQNALINGQFNSASAIPEPIETSQGKIQPARGIQVTESGEVILTAYRTNNSGERLPESSVNCGRT